MYLTLVPAMNTSPSDEAPTQEVGSRKLTSKVQLPPDPRLAPLQWSLLIEKPPLLSGPGTKVSDLSGSEVPVPSLVTVNVAEAMATGKPKSSS
jgi:hypothetical protein